MINVAFYDTKPYDRRYFEQASGADRLRWHFHEFRMTAETAGTAAGAQGVCVFVNDRLDRSCLEGLRQAGVRLIALRCAGFDNVDLEAAREMGLAVTYVPAYSPHAVAEHAVALLLALDRRTHHAYNRTRAHDFSLDGLVGFDVHGKTVGVMGTGRIGRVAAQIFSGFGARVIACDVFPSPVWARAHDVTYTDFDTLLARSDILTLHVPLTPDTLHLLDARAFSRMKRGAFLINTSRGMLIDSTALLAVLKDDRLGGVALDVYENEAGVFFEDFSDRVLQDDTLARLLAFPKVIVTAHQGFLTREALDQIARTTTGNLLALEEGRVFTEGTVLCAGSMTET